MELAQKEKATLENWKKQTDPVKEWIVEAKGKFDNLQHGEGYDIVQEQHEKLEVNSFIVCLSTHVETYNLSMPLFFRLYLRNLPIIKKIMEIFPSLKIPFCRMSICLFHLKITSGTKEILWIRNGMS